MSGKFLQLAQPGQLHGEVRVTVVTVSGGPSLLPADPLPQRKDYLVYNEGSDTVYLGGASVTTVSGIPLISEGTFAAQLGRAELYAVASGTNQTVRVMEIA